CQYNKGGLPSSDSPRPPEGGLRNCGREAPFVVLAIIHFMKIAEVLVELIRSTKFYLMVFNRKEKRSSPEAVGSFFPFILTL
ncbi:MAG: hypothetical protein KAI70_01730, partial [Candidatus Omnitrophica bacterium]|nr:hypothetical protein [Candidatus Omnitrophota bacterium]